jgi:hypothetical protein
MLDGDDNSAYGAKLRGVSLIGRWRGLDIPANCVELGTRNEERTPTRKVEGSDCQSDEGRGRNSNEERGILRLPDEERGSCSRITSTRDEGELPHC